MSEKGKKVTHRKEPGKLVIEAQHDLSEKELDKRISKAEIFSHLHKLSEKGEKATHRREPGKLIIEVPTDLSIEELDKRITKSGLLSDTSGCMTLSGGTTMPAIMNDIGKSLVASLIAHV
jgi:hypothetical protein